MVHNATELIIYPGIAVAFVVLIASLFPANSILAIVIILLLISLYDIWAVWKSQFMQKMAKYQINTLKIFTEFFVTYEHKKQQQKINFIKEKYQNKNKSDSFMENQFKKAKIKINLAILGGGDIIFPIIASGIFYKAYGLIPALIITLFAAIGLSYLLIFAEKKKFYPAMPFLTIAMYLGMILVWLLF